MDSQGLRVPPLAAAPAMSRKEFWLRILFVLALLFVFLVGIRAMGNGFKGLGKDLLDSFFTATDNPLVGLMVGMLATTLVQSSSVTTSMVVALVSAPENPLPIDNAIPMVMGANIGTTVTSTIVALGHIGRRDEFRRAFAAATCHDFFNFLAVAVLLPLETLTGALHRLSGALTSVVGVGGGTKLPNPIKDATKAAAGPIEDLAYTVSDNPKLGATALIVLAALLIFLALTFIVRTLKALAATKMKVYITRSLDANPVVGIIIGIVATVMVQSSSITTSVLVPLAGAGLVTTAQVFPVTLGANVGTTVTALLASMAAPDQTAHLGVQIALVHLLFNLLGILLVYPAKVTRNIPVALAEGLAAVATRSRQVAVLVVLGVFYGVPALLIFVMRTF